MEMPEFSKMLAELSTKMAGQLVGTVAMGLYTARNEATDPDELEANMIKVVSGVQVLSTEMLDTVLQGDTLNTHSTEVFIAIAQSCDLVAEQFRAVLTGEARA